jgi:hypothetical protein
MYSGRRPTNISMNSSSCSSVGWKIAQTLSLLEDVKYRDTLLLLSITLTEKISDAESAEKRRNCIKKILSDLILW